MFLNDSSALRKQLSQYLAEVSDLDREVGLIDVEVDKLGLKNDTIFIFTSEQGSALPYGKWTNYDSGLQTAFIIRWPNRIAAGSISNAMIEYVDILPTLTDLVSSKVPDNLDGKSFKKVLQGQQRKHKEYTFGLQTSFNIHDGAAYPIRSIRSEKYKLIHNLMPEAEFTNILTKSDWFVQELKAEKIKSISNYASYLRHPEYEFYDIRTDPFERVNLIDQAQYTKEIFTLKQALLDWMQQQGDLGIATELSVCERRAFPHKGCGKPR